MAASGNTRSFTDEFLPPFEYFFKVITPEAVQNKKTMLPEKFTITFKAKLPNVATLRGPNGRVWRVGLTKERRNPNRVWFDSGFGDFLCFYSIIARHLLIFKYDGSSGFDVVICDLTACQVVYPNPESQVSPGDEEEDDSDDDEPTEDEVEEEEISDSESDSDERLGRGRIWKEKQVETTGPSSSRRKLTGVKIRAAGTASGSRRLQQPNRPLTAAGRLAGPDGHLWWRLMASRIVTSTKLSCSFDGLSPGSKRGMEKAMDCEPRNPSVLIVMRNFHVCTGGVLYMPSKFAKSYFSGDRERVTLCAYEGKTRFVGEWRAYAAITKPRFSVLYIRGWPEFRSDNNLAEGDVCLFELVDQEEKVFHVYMFRA
ncbi:unnamed protein product [Linum tenue]|uniref:TF-B3 domain-containing protein n=1 Tax=Linum tenue TaxID=586396 RepID=A0AAV0JAR4_9ROSI|nr:unnamed protein product [Linum tenue]